MVLAVEICWPALKTEAELVLSVCCGPGIVESVEDETRVVVLAVPVKE